MGSRDEHNSVHLATNGIINLYMSLQTHLITAFDSKSRQEKQNLISNYNPADVVKERLADLRRDYGRADIVRNGTYEEFNFLSLMDVVNRDRRAFNNHIDSPSNDPDDAWHANTVRPITRNKVISIAAHITASLMFPQVFAQNSRDDEDKASAQVMRDLNNWAANNSDYAHMFVKAVVKALVDPAAILYEGYAEVSRKIKEIQEDGSWTEKEVLDEVYSGFQNLLIPIEEFYIANAYESELQKQPFLIWRRVIDYTEARSKYQHLPEFKHVQPGVKVFYSDEQRGFYEMYDESLAGDLVEELVYFNRSADLELRVVNGVLMDDPDRPIQRKDKRYPFAHMGYEFFGGTDFFYFKSLVDKMSSDQDVIDTLYNMIIDGTFLQIMPPAVVMGDEEIDSSVIAPGMITTLTEESKFQTIDTNNNLNAGLTVLSKVEASLSESSTDPRQSGQRDGTTPPTAFEVARLEANAKTVLGLFGKMISKFVEDFGNLRLSTILQHMTVADGVETLGDTNRLAFRTFLLPVGEGEAGKSKKIVFDETTPTSKEDRRSQGLRLLEEEDRKQMEIVRVNPDLFRRRKYLFKVKADFMPEQSDAVKKALSLEAYDRLIQNPIVDPKAVTADFLIDSYRPGEAEKYLRKVQPQAEQQAKPGNSNISSQILNQAQAASMPR